MANPTVGSHYLYDPDYTPIKGHYYNDMPPCFHDHGQASHDHEDENGDDQPPALIGIEHYQCTHHHDCGHDHGPTKPHLKSAPENFSYVANEGSEFPEYPDIPVNSDPELVIPDTTSPFWEKTGHLRDRFYQFWLMKKLSYYWSKLKDGVIYYGKPMVAPLVKFYHHIYRPYILENLLHVLGGPEHAGRIGRYARYTQYLGTLLTWCTLLVLIGIMGFTTVWTLGLAAPVWALVLGFTGVGLNLAGSMAASAANSGKIEPSYREEIKLHNENNALRKQNNLPEIELEHGYLHSSKERQTVHVHRYAHDGHTWVVGSGSSILASILEFASIAVGLGGIFLMISRFSSVISGAGAAYVNQDRLSLFKRIISKKINSHYGLKHKTDAKKHKAIYQLLSTKLNELNINKNHYYSRWVKFYCYRAIDAAYSNEVEIMRNKASINAVLQNKLQGLTEEDTRFWNNNLLRVKNNQPKKMRFSRDKLRSFRTDELRREDLADTDKEQSVLESMPMLEGFIRDALEGSENPNHKVIISEAVDYFQINNLDAQDETSTLFMLYLKSALYRAVQDKKNKITLLDVTTLNINRVIAANPQFFCLSKDEKKIRLNKSAISQAYPMIGPHGAQIIPDYHAKMLVDHIMIPTLKESTGIEKINRAIETFYTAKMNTLDASSDLFILHLKCALIAHSINDINKNKLANALVLAKDFFSKGQKKKVNKQKVGQMFLVDDHHGGLVPPDDPEKELVENIIIPYLKHEHLQTSFAEMSRAVDAFYHADLDVTDATASLLILHLKCALMKALINDTIKSNDITVHAIRNSMAGYCISKPLNMFELFKSNSKKSVLNIPEITLKLHTIGVKQGKEMEKEFVDRHILPNLKQLTI